MEASCLGLIGIESGGGEGVLDLDKLNFAVDSGSFDMGNGSFALPSCLAALETPVAMRQILGVLPQHHRDIYEAVRTA